MRKEGKDVGEEPVERRVNRAQFETSDEIATREEAERRRRQAGGMAEVQAPAPVPVLVVNEPAPPAEEPLYRPLVVPRAAFAPAAQQPELAVQAPFQPPQMLPVLPPQQQVMAPVPDAAAT